ncbi:hypothetical protein DdX_14423 [Ditylenchus destructor]|uniref:Uncharacterized protein n=1 Tax=Ditylenchus destructor TaxID=166010 RepID=A0AAD4MWV2_9BILA|nr:hypothetical protein DdX_14423 [Ditylenchus destructor]
MRPILVLALTPLVLEVTFLCIVAAQYTYNESNMEQLTRLLGTANLTATNLVEDRRWNPLCELIGTVMRKDIPCDALNDVTRCILPHMTGLNGDGQDCVSMDDMEELKKYDASDLANLCTKRMSEIIDCIYYKCRKVMGERYATILKEIKDVGCAHEDILKQMDACKNSHLTELRQACGSVIKGKAEPDLGNIMEQLDKIDDLCVKYEKARLCVEPVLKEKCNHIMDAHTYFTSKGAVFVNMFYGMFGEPGSLKDGKKPATTSTFTAATYFINTENGTIPATASRTNQPKIPTAITELERNSTKTESAKTVSVPGQNNTPSKTEITAKMNRNYGEDVTGITFPEESDSANLNGLSLILPMIALGLSMCFGYDTWQAITLF